MATWSEGVLYAVLTDLEYCQDERAPLCHRPLLTCSSAPVTKEAEFEQSQAIASATSAGWPPRCIGIAEASRSTAP